LKVSRCLLAENVPRADLKAAFPAAAASAAAIASVNGTGLLPGPSEQTVLFLRQAKNISIFMRRERMSGMTRRGKKVARGNPCAMISP
jgi:hypothetical protein